jgi:transcriptional regulator with XRE-family HTH domain
MDAGPCNQRGLAERLGIGESAVSQVLNNPNNLTLKTIIKYARALGLKISLLAYDDRDTRGPIGSDVFAECWERMGRPQDLSALPEKASIERGAMPPSQHMFTQGTNVHVATFGGVRPKKIEMRPATGKLAA